MVRVISPAKILNSVVLKVAHKMIERDYHSISNQTHSTVGMYLPENRGDDPELEKRLQATKALNVLLSDDESQNDADESISNFVAEYINLAEKVVISSIVNLAIPVIVKDNTEDDCKGEEM